MNTKGIITMYKKDIYTCYGCPHFYADKGDRYQSRHCEIVDIWKCWEEIAKHGNDPEEDGVEIIYEEE